MVRCPLPVAARVVARRGLFHGGSPPADDDGPAGRTAADAILSVLHESGWEMNRGEIDLGARELAARWGREKPWEMRSIGLALEKLIASGEVERPARNTYRLPRPVLHVVGPS